MQQIQATSMGPAGPSCWGLYLGSLIRWHSQVLQIRLGQTVPHSASAPSHVFPCFPMPAMKVPSTLPAAQANNLLWALSFMAHF